MPKFLYTDKEFSKIQNALNIEHENLRLKLIEIAKNFFVETADADGISEFEKLLKISPRDMTLEIRRSRVRQKKRGGLPMTPENVQKLMYEYSTHGDFFIEELGDNRLKLIVRNGNFFSFEETLNALFNYLPAHLIFDFEIVFARDHNIYIALPLIDATSTTIDLDLDIDLLQNIKPYQNIFDIGRVNVGLPNYLTFAQDIFIAFPTMFSEKIFVDTTENDWEDYEKWLLWLKYHYLKFAKNAVVRFYCDDDDFNPDDEEPDITEFNGQFIKIYMNTATDDSTRLLVFPNPDTDISQEELAAKINAVPVEGIFLTRRKTPVKSIYRAVLVDRVIISW